MDTGVTFFVDTFVVGVQQIILNVHGCFFLHSLESFAPISRRPHFGVIFVINKSLDCVDCEHSDIFDEEENANNEGKFGNRVPVRVQVVICCLDNDLWESLESEFCNNLHFVTVLNR